MLRVGPGWRRGIRIGSLEDGSVTAFIDGATPVYPDGSNPEGIAADAAGNVYRAVVAAGGALRKSVKR